MSDFKFLCPECGQKIACDTALIGAQITCPTCQKTLTIPSAPGAAPPAPVAAPAAAATVSGAGVSAVRPSAVTATATTAPGSSIPPPLPPPSLRPAPPATAVPKPRAADPSHYSGLAIASLICSVFVPLGFIPGLICGHMAKTRMRKDVFLEGEKIANAGLIISYCVLAAVLFCGIISLAVQWHFHPVRVVRPSLEAAVAPDYRIVDQIVINETEEDHEFSGPMNSLTNDKKGRRVARGDSFSYVMKVLPHEPMTLNCRYSGDEPKGRDFDIAVDDQVIATQTLNHNEPGKYFDEQYNIPAALTRGKTEVTVEFQGRPNAVAGTLYGCQMLKR
jgi:hypothetical protein